MPQHHIRNIGNFPNFLITISWPIQQMVGETFATISSFQNSIRTQANVKLIADRLAQRPPPAHQEDR